MQPQIIPRSEHCISRKNIDPDALKVLYRLYRSGHTAFLVGGGVRDLLIGRKPKDFDVSTSARPGQVKKLFRNCWLIGRRFRLAHIHFRDHKIIEVSTFRSEPAREEGEAEEDLLVRRDNTFGTPEEDALRRDFTINGLFYDIASFSLIDYVGGVDDIESGVIRTIGDPRIRFREDPVRMIRAVKFGARLDFSIEPETWEALCDHVDEVRKSSTSRVMEEVARLLEGGASCRSIQLLKASGLLRIVLPEVWEYFLGVPAGPGLQREGRRGAEATEEADEDLLLHGDEDDDPEILEALPDDVDDEEGSAAIPNGDDTSRLEVEEPGNDMVYDRMDPAVNLGTPYDMPDDAFASVQPRRDEMAGTTLSGVVPDAGHASTPMESDRALPSEESEGEEASDVPEGSFEDAEDDEDSIVLPGDEEEQDFLTPEGTHCVQAPDRGGLLWRMLGAVDLLVRSGRGLSRPTLYAAILAPIALHTAEWMSSQRRSKEDDVEAWLPRVLGPLTAGVMISRRDRERVCQILMAQRKCQRRVNFSAQAFSRKPYFFDALDLFEITVHATGEHAQTLAWWRDRFPPLAPGERRMEPEDARGWGGRSRRRGRGAVRPDESAEDAAGLEDASDGGDGSADESDRDRQRRRRRRRRRPSVANH